MSFTEAARAHPISLLEGGIEDAGTAEGGNPVGGRSESRKGPPSVGCADISPSRGEIGRHEHPARPGTLAYDTSDPEISGRPLGDLKPAQCRWPVGTWEGEHLFCAAAALPGGSYCARHRARAYRRLGDGGEE